MASSSQNSENDLKKSVVNYFLENCQRILTNATLSTAPIHVRDIRPVSDVLLKKIKDESDAYDFAAQFEINSLSITYQGIVRDNKNMDIENESVAGKSI